MLGLKTSELGNLACQTGLVKMIVYTKLIVTGLLLGFCCGNLFQSFIGEGVWQIRHIRQNSLVIIFIVEGSKVAKKSILALIKMSHHLNMALFKAAQLFTFRQLLHALCHSDIWIKLKEALGCILRRRISLLLRQISRQLIAVEVLLKGRSIIASLGKPLGRHYIDRCLPLQLRGHLLHTKVLIK